MAFENSSSVFERLKAADTAFREAVVAQLREIGASLAGLGLSSRVTLSAARAVLERR